MVHVELIEEVAVDSWRLRSKKYYIYLLDKYDTIFGRHVLPSASRILGLSSKAHNRISPCPSRSSRSFPRRPIRAQTRTSSNNMK